MNAPQMKSAVYQHHIIVVNLCKLLYNTLMNNELTDRITSIFQKTFGDAPAHIVRAPGRVNLLGEHVDYNDGFVLPAAIDRATYIAVSPASTPLSRLVAVDFNQQASFSPQTIPSKTQGDGSPLPAWAHYPAGVMWSLNEARVETHEIGRASCRGRGEISVVA